MFPIRDDQPSFSTPAVTYFLVAFNVAVFLFESTLSQAGRNDLYSQFALIPNHLTSGFRGHGWSLATVVFSIFTSMFLHSSWGHLIWNMLVLSVFGDNVEDHLGHFPYLLFYLASGLGAAVLHAVLNWGSATPTIGASGAIAGVMGAYFLLYPRARVSIFFFTFPAWIVLGFWIMVQILSGVAESLVFSTQNPSSGIAIWAHVGGFAVGMILIKVLPERKGRYRYGTW